MAVGKPSWRILLYRVVGLARDQGAGAIVRDAEALDASHAAV